MPYKSSRYLAAVAYLLVVVGPTLLLALRRDDELVRYHARQALGLVALAVAVFVIWAVVGYVISLLPYFGFIVAVTLFAVVIGVYLVLAAVWITGIVTSLRLQLRPLPIVGKRIDFVFERFAHGKESSIT